MLGFSPITNSSRGRVFRVRSSDEEVMLQLNGRVGVACYAIPCRQKAVPPTTGDHHMRAMTILGAAALFAAVAVPAFAADSMKSDAMGAMGGEMSMMKSGETVAIMPDGHMGTAMSDKMAGDEMMKMAKPMDHCMMFMMGHDGKMYAVDTMGADGMKSCEKMAK